MFSPLNLFGQPFDCTTPHYWLEPSKSYKPEKIEKKVLETTRNVSTDMCENFMMFVLKGMASEFEMFGTSLEEIIALGGNELETFYSGLGEERDRQLSILRKRSPKALERFLRFNNAVYHQEFKKYILDNNQRITHTWIFKDLIAFSDRQQARLVPNEDPTQPLEIEGLIRKLLPEHQWPTVNKFVYLLSARRDHMPDLNCIPILLYIFDCLNRKIEVQHAVIALWQMSYLTLFEELFVLVLFYFQDVIQDKAMFPFLNETMLKACFDYLSSEDDYQVSQQDNQLLYIPFRDFVLEDAIECDPYIAFSKVSHFVHRASADLHTLQSNKMFDFFDDFGSHLKTLGFNFNQLPRPNLSAEVPLVAILDLKSAVAMGIYEPFSELLKEKRAFLLQYEEKRAEVNDKANVLAQNPLDNIEQLNGLAKVKKDLEEQHKAHEGNERSEVEALYSKACQLIEAHNKKFETPHDQSAEEIEVLHGLLADAQHQLQELQQDKKVLAEQLSKAQQVTQKAPSVATDCLEHLVSILEAKNPIRVVIDEVLKRRPWVKVSDKLLKSLDAVAGFSRPAELARQLERLTSKEFLGAVSTKGSVGAFDFFTKQALSFKESDTTMSSQVMRRQREFMFNGKKLMCEPHLKLGNNNTEQEQLRIHFAIEDGAIYIGYIGRHLPTGLM